MGVFFSCNFFLLMASFMENPYRSKWMMTGGSPMTFRKPPNDVIQKYLLGALEHVLYFSIYPFKGLSSSSQLTRSIIFQRVFSSTNQHCSSQWVSTASLPGDESPWKLLGGLVTKKIDHQQYGEY